MTPTLTPATAGQEIPAGKALVKRLRQIRDSYPDGVPLSREDRKVVLAALRQHPRGRAKFGPGINTVTVAGRAGWRHFLVTRSDGTTCDFSIYKCAGVTPPGKPRPGPWRPTARKTTRAADLARRDGAAVREWVAQVVADTGTGPTWREAGEQFGWGGMFSAVIHQAEIADWITTGPEVRSMRPGRRTR